MTVPTRHLKPRPHGPLFALRRAAVVPATRDSVFAFFADAGNLNRLTPSFLKFRLLPQSPSTMGVGTHLEYSIRVHGIPLRWVSEISAWEPPHRFIDTQIRGPYRWWQHEHRFEDLADSTRVIDEVEYACPGGRLIHALFVKRDLERIFAFREQSLSAIFGHETGGSEPPKTTNR